MRFRTATTIIALAASAAFAQDSSWKLVWADEFDQGTAPAAAIWNYEHGFVRNRELQYYTKERPENVRIENGLLVIEGRKERFPNAKHQAEATDWQRAPEFAEYTSGSINTAGKIAWQYGRIEVRAKLPAGKGTWPAIWMMGDKKANPAVRGWPFCGEIDIMEHVGKTPTNIHATCHWGVDGTDRKHRSKGGHTLNHDPKNTYDEFHVYAIEWDKDKIDFFYDDLKYFSFDIAQADMPDGSNPFRQKHYLLLNLALGGSWGGDMDDSALPARYEIDYVRVYEHK